MLTVSQLYLYPIKSLAGIAAPTLTLGENGFLHDRKWMLVDDQDRKITIREVKELCLFRQELDADNLIIRYDDELCRIPLLTSESGEAVSAQFFDRKVDGLALDHRVNQWFSDILHRSVRLIQPHPARPRIVRSAPDHRVHFADSSQYLVIGQGSMDELNDRTGADVDVRRFRANVIVNGTTAHEEDHWKELSIGAHTFLVNKLCARCSVPSVDPDTAERGAEPLASLAKYRKWDRKIWFGTYMNLVSPPGGTISIGDQVLASSALANQG